jgi:MATE family multidrug resistance protein
MSRKPLLFMPPASPWRAEVAASVGLAWPMVMTMVAVIVMETVDILMIGRLGEDALAAAALALNAWFVFLLFGIGLVGAVSPLTAQAVALGDDRGVRRSVRQGLWAGLMMGAPFALILRHAEPALIALGQKPELAAAAQSYLDWMGPVLIVVFLSFPLRLTMASYGVTRPAMLIAWCGVPLNALCNYIFIFGGFGGPEMGLPGAGVATLLVYSLIFAAYLVYIQRTPLFARLELFARFWRADWERFRRLLKIGIPAGMTSVLEHGLFAATALMMGWVGTTELAAHQIAMQIMSITFMVPFGLAQAATIRIGLAAGARDLDAVRLRGRVIMHLTLLAMILAAILFWTMGETLTGLFLAADDPNRAEIVAFGATFLAIAALFQLFDGVQSTGGGSLRGLNDAFVPMLLAVLGYWVLGVSGAYVLGFPLGMGGEGIWYGLLLGLGFAAIAVTIRFHLETRSEAAAFRRIDSDFDPESAV